MAAKKTVLFVMISMSIAAADDPAVEDWSPRADEPAEDGSFYQHCTQRTLSLEMDGIKVYPGKECWQSGGLTHLRLKIMCGFSGGDGYPVKPGKCPRETYPCDISLPHDARVRDYVLRYSLQLGMSFYDRRTDDNGKCAGSLATAAV